MGVSGSAMDSRPRRSLVTIVLRVICVRPLHRVFSGSFEVEEVVLEEEEEEADEDDEVEVVLC